MKEHDELLAGLREPAPSQGGRPVEPDSLAQQMRRGEARPIKAIVPAGTYSRLIVEVAKLRAETGEGTISSVVTELLEGWLSARE